MSDHSPPGSGDARCLCAFAGRLVVVCHGCSAGSPLRDSLVDWFKVFVCLVFYEV